jgi:chromosome segregation ATPase
LADLSGIEKRQALLLGEKEEIERDIAQIEKELDQIRKTREEIETQREKRSQDFASLVTVERKLRATYATILEKFTNGQDRILEGVGSQSRLFFDSERFRGNAEDLFDLRRVDMKDIESHGRRLLGIVSDSNTEQLLADLRQYFRDIGALTESRKKTRTLLDFDNWGI